MTTDTHSPHPPVIICRIADHSHTSVILGSSPQQGHTAWHTCIKNYDICTYSYSTQMSNTNSTNGLAVVTSCLCFALRSLLIRLPSTSQNFFTFTLLPSSSALLQTPKCSEYHPSKQSPVVSILFLTRLQLSATSSPFLSVILPLSVLSSLS